MLDKSRGFHVKLGQKKEDSLHQFAHFKLSMGAFNMNGSTSGERESGPFLQSMLMQFTVQMARRHMYDNTGCFFYTGPPPKSSKCKKLI